MFFTLPKVLLKKVFEQLLTGLEQVELEGTWL